MSAHDMRLGLFILNKSTIEHQVCSKKFEAAATLRDAKDKSDGLLLSENKKATYTS